jgi:hypothetical protein
MLMNELARELPLLRLPPPLQEACRSFFVHGRGGPLPSTPFALRSLPLMMGRLAGKRGALLEVSKVLAELQATCVKHGQLTTQARGRQNTSGLLRPTKKADDDEDFEGARPVRRSGASSGGGAGPGGGTPNPSRALVTEREEMRNSARAKMVHNEQTNLRARQALMEKLDANKKR